MGFNPDWKGLPSPLDVQPGSAASAQRNSEIMGTAESGGRGRGRAEGDDEEEEERAKKRKTQQAAIERGAVDRYGASMGQGWKPFDSRRYQQAASLVGRR